MVKHIVMWRLHDEVDGVPKRESAVIIKKALEALQGKIPGLLHIEAGIDFNDSDQSADIVLYSKLESREALEAYQLHPLHQAVVPLVKKYACERTVVDFEA
ncbi:MAG: Dabb family protein [Mariprofundaceae bacterium]|nr:Dabb family protein [Mariprofundaceae bacterium]